MQPKDKQKNIKKMGNILTIAYDRIRCKRQAKVVMIGINSSGRTTSLYKMKLKNTVNTVPTVGFNVESIEFR